MTTTIMTHTAEPNNMVEERYQLCKSLYLIKKKQTKETRRRGTKEQTGKT